jgi:hypothetical protein
MKLSYKRLLTCVVFIIVFSVIPGLANAQFGDGPGGDPDAPIDGGVGLLVAAGVGYGIKKVKANRKKNSLQSEIHQAK